MEEIRRLRRGEQNAVPVPGERAPPEKLAVLPKSISVRSKDYLKMNQPAKAPATSVANNRKPRTANPTVNNNHGSVSLFRSRPASSSVLRHLTLLHAP
jgi:butyrate response factor